MKPNIIQLEGKKLIGHKLTMSVENNLTAALWGKFMPRRNEIKNRVGTDFISMQIYPKAYHMNFIPEREFQKWAAVEVSDFDNVPANMESFILTGGTYAVFDYKGSSSDPTIFQYIYNHWLPNSKYELDDRPHFEVLGKNYKNNDPNSEEEIWIPTKKV